MPEIEFVVTLDVTEHGRPMGLGVDRIEKGLRAHVTDRQAQALIDAGTAKLYTPQPIAAPPLPVAVETPQTEQPRPNRPKYKRSN